MYLSTLNQSSPLLYLNCLNFRCTVDPETFIIEVRAQRNIRKGEEITTRYFEPWIGQPRRVLSIEKNWNFICNCARCQDPTDFETYFSAIKCQTCYENSHFSDDILDNDNMASHSDGCYVPNNTQNLESLWSCNKCGEEKAVYEIEHILTTMEEILEDMKSKLTKIRENNLPKFGKYIESSFHMLHQYLHPNHFLIFHYKIWILELELPNDILQHTKIKEKEILDSSTKDEILEAVSLLELQLKYHKDVISLIETLDPGLSISMAQHLKHQAQTRIQLSQLKQLINSENYSKMEYMTQMEKAFCELQQASIYFDYPEKKNFIS